MKNILLLALLLPMCCDAQKDPCPKIKKSTDDSRGMISYTSPDLKYLSVLKQYKTDTAFGLVIHFTDAIQHFDTYGLSIEFDDGSVFDNDSRPVRCVQNKSVIAAGNTSAASASSGEYMLQAYYGFNADNIEAFTTKLIARVRLHSAKQTIPDKEARAIQAYIKCLNAIE